MGPLESLQRFLERFHDLLSIRFVFNLGGVRRHKARVTEQRSPLFRPPHCAGQPGDAGEEADHDVGIVGPVNADLVEGSIGKLIKFQLARHHAQPAPFIVARGQRPRPAQDTAQGGAQPINAGDSRERLVDAGDKACAAISTNCCKEYNASW